MIPQKALIQSSNYLTEQLGNSPTGVPIGQDPVVAANLHLCYYNAFGNSQQNWDLFMAHVCWPEENEFPEHLFLISQDQVPGYKRLMNRIEELYNE